MLSSTKISFLFQSIDRDILYISSANHIVKEREKDWGWIHPFTTWAGGMDPAPITKTKKTMADYRRCIVMRLIQCTWFQINLRCLNIFICLLILIWIIHNDVLKCSKISSVLVLNYNPLSFYLHPKLSWSFLDLQYLNYHIFHN